MFQPGTKIANPYRGIILERVDKIPEGNYGSGQPGYLVWWCLIHTGDNPSESKELYQPRADNALKDRDNATYMCGNLRWVPMSHLHHPSVTNWYGHQL